MSDTPLLRLDEVSRIYGEEVKVHALDGVSLDIKVGEFVSIVGPSGSGKSTMLGLLGLLDLPSLGTLSVDGTSVADLSDHDRSTLRGEVVGFIFQQFHLIPHLDARRNVETALLYRQMSPRERKRRAMDALEVVGLRLGTSIDRSRCRAASSNVARLPGQSSRNRSCCSQMNRRAHSTPPTPPT